MIDQLTKHRSCGNANVDVRMLYGWGQLTLEERVDMDRLRSQEETLFYRVIADYEIAYPDPLIVRAGEILAVGKEDDEYPGWVWCINKRGKGGWVPRDCIEGAEEGTMARYDYAATELSASVGDQVTVSREKNGWAWCINASRQSGWLPLDHLERAT